MGFLLILKSTKRDKSRNTMTLTTANKLTIDFFGSLHKLSHKIMIKKVLEQFMIRLDNMYLTLGPDLVHASFCQHRIDLLLI